MAGLFDTFAQIERMRGPQANLLGVGGDTQPSTNQQLSFLDTIQRNLMQTFGPQAFQQANQGLTGMDALLGVGQQLGRQFAGMQAANLTPPTVHGVLGPSFGGVRVPTLPLLAGIGG